MSPRLLINVGLLLTIIIVALILFFTEDKKQQNNTIYISDIGANTISTIYLRNSADEIIEFSNINNYWKINNPLDISANPDRIKALLGLLSLASATKLPINEVQLEKLELEPARAILKFNEHEFAFGGVDAIDEYRYVLFKNNVYLIEDRLYPQLNSGLHFFIDNRLAPDKNISSIIINEKEYLADKNPALIQSWSNARAMNITRYSGAETNGFITITDKGGTSLDYEIIADDERLRLARKEKGVEYHLLSTDRKELLKLDEKSSDITETITITD